MQLCVCVCVCVYRLRERCVLDKRDIMKSGRNVSHI